MNNFAQSVSSNLEDFMTACEDLKRFDKEIQKLTTLECLNHGILEELVKRYRNRYNERIKQILDEYSNGYDSWKHPRRDFVNRIREDLKDILRSVEAIKCAYGMIDKYKDEKDEKIEFLQGIIKSEDEEIKRQYRNSFDWFGFGLEGENQL